MTDAERLVGTFAHALGGEATVIGGAVELATARIGRALELLDGHPARLELEAALAMLEGGQAAIKRLSSVHSGLVSLAARTVEPPENVDLRALLQRACVAYASEIRMRCRLQVEPGPPCRLVTSPTHVLRALLGALQSVVEALPTSRPLPRLEVFTWREDEVLGVTFLGPFRVGREDIPGLLATTGPLALVDGLLDTRVRRDGRGEVTISLPSTLEPDETTDEELAPGRVLVVDDDGEVGRMLVSLFEALGCDATWVCGPFAALDKLRRRASYDLVLVDRLMPGMSGEQFYEALTEELPHVAPRVVLCTAGDYRVDPALRHLTPCPSLRKPTTLDEVRAVLSRPLG